MFANITHSPQAIADLSIEFPAAKTLRNSTLLSYRHSFHAGNFADVLKHIVLTEALGHLAKKDAAFDYIDTHAGAGLFNLASSQSAKLQEYTNGIGKLIPNEWPELSAYFDAISTHNASNKLSFYPGSPLIATHFLRSQDRAWLYELHPKDAERLKYNTRGNKQARVKQEDGFKGLLSLVPPVSRRGLVLIDPPYEVKTDYDQVVKTVTSAYKKFTTGTYAIWYPVVDRQRIDRLERKFITSGIRNIQRFELGIASDCDERGMSASGMIVINPPWTLMDKMSQLLPKLVNTLGEDDSAFCKYDVLVGE